MKGFWADNTGGKLGRKKRRLSNLIDEIDMVRATIPEQMISRHPTLDRLYRHADILVREIKVMTR